MLFLQSQPRPYKYLIQRHLCTALSPPYPRVLAVRLKEYMYHSRCNFFIVRGRIQCPGCLPIDDRKACLFVYRLASAIYLRIQVYSTVCFQSTRGKPQTGRINADMDTPILRQRRKLCGSNREITRVSHPLMPNGSWNTYTL